MVDRKKLDLPPPNYVFKAGMLVCDSALVGGGPAQYWIDVLGGGLAARLIPDATTKLAIFNNVVTQVPIAALNALVQNCAGPPLYAGSCVVDIGGDISFLDGMLMRHIVNPPALTQFNFSTANMKVMSEGSATFLGWKNAANDINTSVLTYSWSE